ncbi:MAG: 16S rRNA (cytosine(967)-C(5))-methyltransferase RsmB [Gammaproteobacteria bacterium]|nr:16S rRNA (cytosine(967)-C(5))-methyltransferase RsmB [Gammaproteobacteria bacterium]
MSKPTRVTGRTQAHTTLQRILIEGRSLELALQGETKGLHEAREIAFARELTYGTVRQLPRLEKLAAMLLSKPLPAKGAPVHVALLLGLYQLIYTRVPAHAAISESVNLLASDKLRWGRGVVNGCLRNFQRNRAALEARLDDDISAQYAHAAWIVDALKRDWPQDWAAILNANNERAAMTLRVNRQRVSRNEYLKALEEAGIDASPAAHSPAGVVLSTAQITEALPGFKDGLVSVQDEASQLAAELMDLKPGHRVLDACAAPGGKTAHMLETQAMLELTAVDKDPARLATLEANLARLGLEAHCKAHDVAQTAHWWDRKPFDRILLDAPCSAFGVIRRHPDIKFHRRPEDIIALSKLQATLLEKMWELLADGGQLLYATCSVFQAENCDQIARFLAHRSDAQLLPIDATWGQDAVAGRQILPGMGGMDGFFYARIRKG